MQREVTMSEKTAVTRYAWSEGTLFLSVIDWARNCCWIFLRLLLECIRLKSELILQRNRIEELEVENQKLYEQAHLGSDTSGIPSSKDWKGNGASKGVEETSGSDANPGVGVDKETPISISDYLKDTAGGKRRPGGQEKHPPAFMHINDVREGEPVLHYPDKCASCPRFAQCVEGGRFRKYFTAHGYDIEVVRVHRKHILFEATVCMDSGCPIHDDFSEVIGSQFYDTNVQLHVLTWHHIFHGSYDRIDLASKELFGLSLSAGTANAIVQRTSAKILDSGFVDAVRFFVLLFETVTGVDETSARVGGRNAWVHTVVTRNITLLSAHWRRGYEGSVYAGVLQFFTQSLISDCWTAYFNENFKFRHSVCGGHILRELVAAAYFRQQGWAIEMFDLLLEILSDKRDAVAQGEKGLSREYIIDITARYRQIVADGYKENAGATKGKTFSLLERLNNLEDAVLAFAVDFSVDFTNNASEQSLRNLKVALRVIGQFKTMSGLADYCIIQSFIDTCRKLGHNPYDMLRIVLSGGDVIVPLFGSEKAAQINQMIRLSAAYAEGDSAEVNAIIADMPSLPNDELLAAAAYGRFKVYNDPPPEKSNPSPAVPKDKMQAARDSISPKQSDATTAPSDDLIQPDFRNPPKDNKKMIRAGPKSA